MLRYHGKPIPERNREVDKLEPICMCRFVAVGRPLDGRKCLVHGDKIYPCDRCAYCDNYRPCSVKKFSIHWPLCTCGHIAQDHNAPKWSGL